MTHGESIDVQTRGNSHIVDITGQVVEIVNRSGAQEGLATVFAVGSTASISTIEYEPALVEDFREQLDRFASSTMHSRHSQTWGDDNGYSHIRATFMGPSLTVPIHKGQLVLGTWQQIVLIDHDNRPRKRNVFVQVMGE